MIAGSAHGQTIKVSAAMPVPGQTVIITVLGLPPGGAVTVTDPGGMVVPLSTNPAGGANWTPSRYGKYIVTAGSSTRTIRVTSRPMTFHWWAAALAQENVTSVMSDDAAWKDRGVTMVKWVGGEAYSRGVDGHSWTEASEWLSNWTQGNAAEGVAIDEAFFDSGFPSDEIVEAITGLRDTRGPDYAIYLWSMGFAAGFSESAAILQQDQVKVLIEDYTGDRDTHVFKWNYARAYGLENRSVFGIWPGNAPLTDAAAIRADMAELRLAAPEANGIAIFDPAVNLLAATDNAIEDFFLDPVIHLSHPTNGKLGVWNIGNEDAVGFSLQFLNVSGDLVETADLSSLPANEKRDLSVPAGATHARIINPPGTADLYENNPRYPNALIPTSVAGRHVWDNSDGDAQWTTPGNWEPQGPPPGNIDSGKLATFDSGMATPGTVIAKTGETSIGSVVFANAGWTVEGHPVSQNFYTYSIVSEGIGTNAINIGLSSRDVVPALFRVGTGNHLIVNGRVGAVRNSGGLRKFGLGELTLNHSNTFLGDIWIRGGKLTIGGNGSLGEGDYAPGIVIDNGCTFRYTSTAAQRLSGGIEGNGALIQSGPGSLTLEGANPITGAVLVENGHLIVNGSLPDTGVTVAAAGTLGGTGSFGKTISVDGSLAPGVAGTGTLHAANVDLRGRFACEVNGIDSDRLSLSGRLDLTGASLEVSPTGSGFTAGHYVIATYGTLTGTFANVPPAYSVRYGQGGNGNEIWLVETKTYAEWSAFHADGQAINLDHDHDGILNGIEFFTGSGVPAASPGDFTWPKSIAYSGRYGVDYWLQVSPNLATWTMVPANDPRLHDGEVLRYTFPSDEDKKFLRLRVTGP